MDQPGRRNYRRRRRAGGKRPRWPATAVALLPRARGQVKATPLMCLCFYHGGTETQSGEAATNVAQTFCLPYRGFSTCEAQVHSRALEISNVLPAASRQYGRLQVCAAKLLRLCASLPLWLL